MKTTPIRLMLVDDNLTFLHILAHFLRQYPEVDVIGMADGGKEALDQVQDLQPDIILMDLAMPGLNGFETIHLLRQVLPGVSIIALTLINANSYRQAALAAGADDFVAKADLDTGLLPTIRKVANRAASSGASGQNRDGAKRANEQCNNPKLSMEKAALNLAA